VRIKVAPVLLALAMGMSACGGTQDDTPLGAAGTTATAQTNAGRDGKRPRNDPRKSCAEQGIDSTSLGEGACTEQGIHYVVANRQSLLRLRTLAVAIINISAGGGAGGGERTARPQRGAFVRVTLMVQNRDKVPHRFALGQTMLGIGENNYLEAIEVERSVHREALARINGGRLLPGETLRGDVLFDVVPTDVDLIARQGRLFVFNFGQRAALALPRGAGHQLGQFRLYAG
jgi:hypothetical protein